MGAAVRRTSERRDRPGLTDKVVVGSEQDSDRGPENMARFERRIEGLGQSCDKGLEAAFLVGSEQHSLLAALTADERTVG